MSTQPQTHRNHQTHRASKAPNRDARAPHQVQARVPALKPGTAAASRAPAPSASKPRTQPVGSSPAPSPTNYKATPLTHTDISRMMSAVSKQHGGAVPRNSYVAEMQSRLDKREAPKEAPQRKGQGKR